MDPLCCTPPGPTLVPSEMCSLCLPRGLKPTSPGREPHTVLVLLYQEKVGQPARARQRSGGSCALRKHLGLSPDPRGCFCPTELIQALWRIVFLLGHTLQEPHVQLKGARADSSTGHRLSLGDHREPSKRCAGGPGPGDPACASEPCHAAWCL